MPEYRPPSGRADTPRFAEGAFMKQIVSIIVLACGVGSATAETNVGISIGIIQPGVYGRVDIGSYPQPAVVYARPLIIVPQPLIVRPQPVYLYVPSGHQKNWAKHCSRYGACGQPVYFVRESWVSEQHETRQQHARAESAGKKPKKHKD
jgi:hypothetical protein